MSWIYEERQKYFTGQQMVFVAGSKKYERAKNLNGDPFSTALSKDHV
jgi:hypothetical protein